MRPGAPNFFPTPHLRLTLLQACSSHSLLPPLNPTALGLPHSIAARRASYARCRPKPLGLRDRLVASCAHRATRDRVAMLPQPRPLVCAPFPLNTSAAALHAPARAYPRAAPRTMRAIELLG